MFLIKFLYKKSFSAKLHFKDRQSVKMFFINKTIIKQLKQILMAARGPQFADSFFN